ncbi:MAG: hypothetical protein M0Q93_07160 [Terrimicrobiaceae bacterium]|nr:hypothetical protein [Terrimicrobiaceae bacterium]
MASLQKAQDRGESDLEAREEAIRNAVLRYGASLLEGLLADAGCGRRKQPLLGADGHPMHSIGVRTKTLTTLLGKVPLRRSVFEDAKGCHTRIPLDENLGVEGTCFSPGVRRFMARAGSRSSFADASEDLAVYARLEATAKQVQRVAEDAGRSVEDWISRQVPADNPEDVPAPVPILYVSFDGTGIPMRKDELFATKGKADASAARSPSSSWATTTCSAPCASQSSEPCSPLSGRLPATHSTCPTIRLSRSRGTGALLGASFDFLTSGLKAFAHFVNGVIDSGPGALRGTSRTGATDEESEGCENKKSGFHDGAVTFCKPTIAQSGNAGKLMESKSGARDDRRHHSALPMPRNRFLFVGNMDSAVHHFVGHPHINLPHR